MNRSHVSLRSQKSSTTMLVVDDGTAHDACDLELAADNLEAQLDEDEENKEEGEQEEEEEEEEKEEEKKDDEEEEEDKKDDDDEAEEKEVTEENHGQSLLPTKYREARRMNDELILSFTYIRSRTSSR